MEIKKIVATGAKSLAVAFLQLIGANIVTFLMSLALPWLSPEARPKLFVLLVGIAFSAGIFLAGLLPLRSRWLPGAPGYVARGVGTLAGVYVPLLVALVAGQVVTASPFFFVSMLGGILGFQVPGWIGARSQA